MSEKQTTEKLRRVDGEKSATWSIGYDTFHTDADGLLTVPVELAAKAIATGFWERYEAPPKPTRKSRVIEEADNGR